MKITEEFISASINPRSHCLTACKSKPLVVYASALQIAVQEVPKSATKPGTIKSLSERRHQKPITVLKRLKSAEKIDEFVSGGVDSRVNLWKLNNEEQVIFVSELKSCSGSIGSVCGVSENDRKVVAAAWVSEHSNGFQAWWTSSSGESTHSDTIQMEHKAFALCLDAISFANTILLAVGTSKRFVELFGESENRKSFEKLISVAGHTDWIHSIAFNDDPSHLLIASAGQDTYVRLWSIENSSGSGASENNEEIDELTSSASLFVLHGATWRCSAHSVMLGHDDWVHSTSWSSDGSKLLTASSDKTVIIWKLIDELWRDDVRLGIVGGQAAGFFSAEFFVDDNLVVAGSYFGGLHAWSNDFSFWKALPMTAGHVGEVRDVDWEKGAEPKGAESESSYLLSVGQDQTTRIFTRNCANSEHHYMEIGRPQVHGHDMQCISSVNPAVFVSGAEEKVFRAFRAPKSFVKSIETISGISQEHIFGAHRIAEFGACVPALGLSNKPMIEGETVDGEHWEEDAFRAEPMVLRSAPTEDTLQQNTLWPEEHKLYGHGYEVYAIATNPSGKVLATACKSSHLEHSVVMLWSTSDWSKKAEIIGHQLTVTQISWNPSGTALLTVSRDRTAKLYREINGDGDGFNYECSWSSGKEHTRIIWACDWLDDAHFITASRDQKVIVWEHQNAQNARVESSIKLAEPVTAVAVSGNVIVAGLQTGELVVIRKTGELLEVVQKIDENPIPIDAAILRLRFSKSGKKLAVASSDAKLRVFDFSE